MNQTKVNKIVLLEKIRQNRNTHVSEFNKAYTGYVNTAITQLSANLTKAKDGKEFSTYINLEAPENHVKDYDRVIAALEMSVEDTITVSSHEFSNFVMDEWSWKTKFMSLNSTYSR